MPVVEHNGVEVHACERGAFKAHSRRLYSASAKRSAGIGMHVDPKSKHFDLKLLAKIGYSARSLEHMTAGTAPHSVNMALIWFALNCTKKKKERARGRNISRAIY